MSAELMFSRLTYTFTRERRWRLTLPLMYFHSTGTIVVPTGFVTDLDSVPRLPIVYAVFKGRAVKAAVVHDYLYEAQRGRAFADGVFLDAMKHEGLPARWRYPMYWAVRMFGGAIYARKDNATDRTNAASDAGRPGAGRNPELGAPDRAGRRHPAGPNDGDL